MRVFIITGEREGGKTRFLNELFESFASGGKTVMGFLSLGRINEQGDKDFDVLDLTTQKKLPLASRTSREGYLRLGRFFFNTHALEFGNEIIDQALNQNCDILIMDEIGPVELSGQAWHSALKKVVANYKGNLIISVRKRLIDAVIKEFSLLNPEILDIGKLGKSKPGDIWHTIALDRI